MGSKKFEIKPGTKNLLSDCVGLITTILKEKRGKKHFDSFEATFLAFQQRVLISPEFWKPVAKGVTKWQQAIRNAAKVHAKKRTPDALTQGELMALVGGGFALPDTVPSDRQVVKFPDIGGIKVPKKKAKTADLDLEENRARRTVRSIRRAIIEHMNAIDEELEQLKAYDERRR